MDEATLNNAHSLAQHESDVQRAAASKAAIGRPGRSRSYNPTMIHAETGR
jgi:hypothetical protein